MLLPIALGMMGVLGGLISDQADDDVADVSRLRFGTALMLMIAYGAGVGGLLTPIRKAPNLLGLDYIEQATGINYLILRVDELTAAPVVLPMFVVLCIILILLNRPEVRRISGAEEYVNEERKQARSDLSYGERNTIVVFAVAVSLWLLPGVVALIFGDESTAYSFIYSRLDEGIVAVVADVLLFMVPFNWRERRFTMTWNDVVKIDWGTIILFGCGIALVTAPGNRPPGSIGKAIADASVFSSVVAVSAVSAVIAVQIISETTSNTASATIVVPIVLPDGHRGRPRPAGAGPLRPFRGLFRVHPARLDPSERRRLRLGDDPHNQDGSLRDSLRHHRAHPDRAPGPRHGHPDHRLRRNRYQPDFSSAR